MSGICTPIKETIYLKGQNSEIAIKLTPGSDWNFFPDVYHADRLMVDDNKGIVASITVSRFYEYFEIKERREA